VGDLGDLGDVAAGALIVARLEEEAAALCWCSWMQQKCPWLLCGNLESICSSRETRIASLLASRDLCRVLSLSWILLARSENWQTVDTCMPSTSSSSFDRKLREQICSITSQQAMNRRNQIAATPTALIE
jgi:hypothetical protein